MTVIYTDGGCRGNPGPSAAGVYIPHMDLKLGFPLEDTTNNVAEYHALLYGLQTTLSLGLSSVEFRADSELMVKQMTGIYAVRSENLFPLWQKARELEGTRNISYVHVPRADNKVADKICNLTMDAMALGYKGPGIRWGNLDEPDQVLEQLLDTTFLT